MENNPKVFVYGTLKTDEPNNPLLADQTFVGRAKITGDYTMLDLGAYPGVVRAGSGGVADIVGEVWQVDQATLDSLDILEGHPDFYQRQKVTTEHGNVWVYFLPAAWLQELGPAAVISSGEWNGG